MLQRQPWGAKRRASFNSERSFQEQVETLAAHLGWYVWHVNNPMRSKAGFPDLILIRERVIWAELKARSRLTNRMGKLMPEQIMWRDMLQAADQEWYLFTDEDWDLIASTLARPGQKVQVV